MNRRWITSIIVTGILPVVAVSAAEQPSVSVVVEQGHSVPAQPAASAQRGHFQRPAIAAGAVHEERFVAVPGSSSPLRVATVPAGGVENLLRYVPAGHPALIELGDHYAVVDESLLPETDEGVSEFHRFPGARSGAANDVTVQGVCIRTPFKPGKVNWHIGNPGTHRYGWFFSYLPEGGGGLRWASSPSDDIDAIYRRAWGCSSPSRKTVLKVPDSCTLDWYSDGYRQCCNAAAALGKVPKWVHGAHEGFPNCPLQ